MSSDHDIGNASPSLAHDLRTIAPLALLIIMATILGGGGVRYALPNLAVQICALAVLGLSRSGVVAFWTQAQTALRVLVLAMVALPVVQLVPLPEGIWENLPGRDLQVEAYAAAGIEGWAAISVDPTRTAVAAIGLIAPMALLMAGWAASREQLLLLGWLFVLLALLQVIIGVLQVLWVGEAAVLYPRIAGTDILYGTFANRNSTGLFLVGAVCLIVFLPVPFGHPLTKPAKIALALLFLVAIFLTRSRTAVLLIVIPAALAALFYLNAKVVSRKKAALIVLASAAVAGSVLTIAPGRIGDTLDRFDADGDARLYIWEDATHSVERFWPLGAGMGTFDEVFQIDEALENLTPRRAGRAHSDYLELAIEAGLPGLVLAFAMLAILAWLTWRARTDHHKWVAWSASAFLLAIALQSTTDYPLRNQSMTVFATYAVLLLARIARGGDARR